MSDTRRTGKVFIVGPPRSGTTVIGNLLGTHPDIAYFGEFFAFFFSSVTAVSVLQRVPSPVRDRYLRDLERHAESFAQEVHAESGRPFFCDSTPWNALIASQLAVRFTDAVFIVTLRHYIGVIQSLVRSFRNGYRMTADSHVARGSLWAQCYNEILRVPQDRVIVVDYDRLCIDPEPTIQKLLHDVEKALTIDVAGFDLSALTRSYVTNPHDGRETIAVATGPGSLVFRSKRNYDPAAWSVLDELAVREVVQPTVQLLAAAFPSAEMANPNVRGSNRVSALDR